MLTFKIKYESGALAKSATASGNDVYEAIRSLGVSNAEAFMASRVITWEVVR